MESHTSLSVTTCPAHAGQEIRRGLKDALPVMAGFMPFALVLGAQAAQKGLSSIEVPLLTGMNFGGGSEFAAIALWASPPHLVLIVAVTLLVNSRHLLMGAVLAPYVQNLPRRKVLPALFFMCDESWAMALADARTRAGSGSKNPFSMAYYMGVSIGLYLTWIVFTFTGAMVGPMIGDVEAWGFHMAFPAVFLVLMRGMWKGLRAAVPWLLSLVAAAVAYLTVPGAWYVAIGAFVGLGTAYLMAGAER